MMPKVSDSAGANIDLRENKNATLWRRFTADELPDELTALDGYVPFFRLEPRGVEPIAVLDITVINNTIEFEFDTTGLPAKCPYVFGWVDPTGKTEVLMYGFVVLV